MRLIIDVGCNVLEGFKKLKYIENVKDEDFKIFVEANPECWHFLDSEISKIPNSVFLRKALYKENTVIDLITRADKRTDTAATVLGKQFIEDSLNRWNIKVDKFNEYSVSTITIEDIIKIHNHKFESIILKLDAEGVEYDVINQILEKNIPIDKMYCEFHIHNENDNLRKQELLKKMSLHNIQFFNWD